MDKLNPPNKDGFFSGYDLAKRILPDSLQIELDTYLFVLNKFDGNSSFFCSKIFSSFYDDLLELKKIGGLFEPKRLLLRLSSCFDGYFSFCSVIMGSVGGISGGGGGFN